MSCFFAYLIKETTEYIRKFRFIVFIAVFFILAIMDVAMIRFLPDILKLSGMDGTAMESMGLIMPPQTVAIAVGSFFADMGEIGPIALALALMGLLADERGKRLIIIPRTSGARAYHIVPAKFLVNTFFITITAILASASAYLLADILFEIPADATFADAIVSSLLISLYYAVYSAAAIFFGSFFNKKILAALCVIGMSFISALPGTLFPKIAEYMPVNLITKASMLAASPDVLIPAFICAALILVFTLSACMIFDRRAV